MSKVLLRLLFLVVFTLTARGCDFHLEFAGNATFTVSAKEPAASMPLGHKSKATARAPKRPQARKVKKP